MGKHSAKIEKQKIVKKYFDELGLAKLPTIKTLQAEYATVNTDKKKLYAEYNIAKNYMQEILMAKQNIKQLLNYKDDSQEVKKKNFRTIVAGSHCFLGFVFDM